MHSIGNLSARIVEDGHVCLAFSADVYPEDPRLDAVAELERRHKAVKKGANVRVYDQLFVRHWSVKFARAARTT
jgi:hypothetical protein